jgi:hypothetical protein
MLARVPVFAHGVGARGDLPLPLWMFTWASALALVISFVALGTLWTTPRLAKAAVGRQLTSPPLAGWLNGLRWVGRIAALALFMLALWAGLIGTNDTGNNLLPVTLYVVVWVGAQLLSGLVGNVWHAINPLVTLAEIVETLAGRSMSSGQAASTQWPAAAGLAVFLFYELAHPTGSTPRSLAWMLLAHTLVSLVLAARWGSAWLADHEPFSALFSMIGAMSPLTVTDGSLRLRGPMSGLANMPVVPGTLAALLIVLGGTTFDGFAESEAGRELLGRPEGWGGAATLTLGLVASTLLVAALFFAGLWWTQRVTEVQLGELGRAFTPSLVPIVFGYAIAHYAQLLVDETQSFVFQLSDPAGQGWNVLGGADGQIDFNIIGSGAMAWIRVLAVLLGHVGAVAVAHDRSIELFSARDSLRSQFAMLFVMVGYSTLGLWLLLNA